MTSWWKKKKEDELEEEVRSHLQMATQEHAERGTKKEEAAYSAQREFGNVALVKETTRDVWDREWLSHFFADIRYATRSLLKHPGFCAVAILTLALGVGANTAIFSVIHAVLLKPLPYKDPSQIVTVYSRNEAFKGLYLNVSLGDVEQVKREAHSFSGFMIYDEASKNLTDQGEPHEINIADTGDNFFDFLGASPQVGRFFVEPEHHSGSNEVAVISDALWRTNFGADPGILTRKLRLDGNLYSIVGVAQAGFGFPARDTAVWLPASPTLAESQDHGNHTYEVLARLRQDATLQQANNELQAISEQIERENKSGFGGWRMFTANLQEYTVSDARPALLILLGAVMLVLLIACANVANLLLTRGTQRYREMALRSALGASRWRIAQLLVTESVLLSVAGGVLGLALAGGGVQAFRSLAPEGIPRIEELHPDWAMALSSMACAFLVGILFGILPALQAARCDPSAGLKEAATGAAPTRQHLRDAFAILEIAMALPLLVGAGLLVKGFTSLTHRSMGFRTDHVLLMSVNLPETKYPKDSQQLFYAKEVLETVRGVGGVETAAISHFYPLSGMLPLSAGLKVEGEPASSPGIGNIETNAVSADYFQTMNVPVLRGRGFTPQDDENGQLVVLVNETMARQVWKGRNPIGSRLLGIESKKGLPLLVVGIVGDTRDVNLSEAPRPNLYYPLAQAPAAHLNLLVRSKDDPAKLAPVLRERIWSIDKDQPISNVQTMDRVLAHSVAEPRFRTILVGTFAVLGVILAAIGIYGVVSYSVSLRTREIGVRVAMGAQGKNVMQLVVGHGLRIAAIGITIGLAVAFSLSKFLASLLYAVSSRDPWIFSGITLVLAATSLLACWIPARRATKVDPLVALRYE